MQFAHFKPEFLAKIFTLGKSTSLINSPWTMYLPALFANGIRAGLFISIFRLDDPIAIYLAPLDGSAALLASGELPSA